MTFNNYHGVNKTINVINLDWYEPYRVPVRTFLGAFVWFLAIPKIIKKIPGVIGVCNMITELILNVWLAPMKLALSGIGEVSISIPGNIYNYIHDILGLASYILPVQSIVTVLGISLTLTLTRIIIALVVRVKSFIPTMGA